MTDVGCADGIMKSIDSVRLMTCWEDVLDRQTRLFGPTEMDLLARWGFGDECRGILDVGTGDGRYGSLLAAAVPHAPVYGVESNPRFAGRARARAGSNYSVHLCKMGVDPLPPVVRGSFDRAIARLVLQHVSEPSMVLRTIHRELPPGGRLVVVEEDDQFFRASPDFGAFERAVEIWRRICRAEGTDSAIGAKVPRLLMESGFEVESVHVLVYNTIDLGAELIEYVLSVLSMFHLTNPSLLPPEELESVEAELRGDDGVASNQCFGTYSCVVVSGRKAARCT